MVTVTTRHLAALEHAERRMYPVRPGEAYEDLAVMAALIKDV
jgi:hypothetical protein